MHSCQSKCVLKKRAEGNSGPSGLVRWRCAGGFFLIYGRTAFRRRENLIFSRPRIGSEMESVSPFLSPAISEHPPAPCSAHQKSGTRIVSFALSRTTLSSKMNGWQVYFSQGGAAGSLHVDLFESIIKVSAAGHRQISSERWKAEMETPVPFLSRVGDRKI